MKRIILACFILFAGISSSFAYNNGVGAFAMSADSQYGTTPANVTQIVNINANCEIFYQTTWTRGAWGTSTSSAYAYLKNGGSMVAYTTYDGTASGPSSSTFTGYWGTMELTISCGTNTIGLAELRW
jgi:hypothetical protein